MIDGDFMEIGDSGWVPLADGWMTNKNTGETMDPDGRIYNKFGECIIDPPEE